MTERKFRPAEWKGRKEKRRKMRMDRERGKERRSHWDHEEQGGRNFNMDGRPLLSRQTP